MDFCLKISSAIFLAKVMFENTLWCRPHYFNYCFFYYSLHIVADSSYSQIDDCHYFEIWKGVFCQNGHSKLAN